MNGCQGFIVPTCEVVADYGRFGRSRNHAILVLSNRSYFVSPVGIKGDGVLVDLPFGVQSRISCGHGREYERDRQNFIKPPNKGISGFVGCRRSGNARTKFLSDR